MSLTDLSLDPSLVYVGVAAGLYLLGSRGRGRPKPLQLAAFTAVFAGLQRSADQNPDDIVARWRLESAEATRRFLESLVSP